MPSSRYLSAACFGFAVCVQEQRLGLSILCSLCDCGSLVHKTTTTIQHIGLVHMLTSPMRADQVVRYYGEDSTPIARTTQTRHHFYSFVCCSICIANSKLL